MTTLGLDNGLTVIHLHIPRYRAEHFGVAVRAGSCDETRAKEHGLAHFVEHTIFKGTRRRSSWHIINRMEAVGGEINAFTTKEDTVIYSTFPKGALCRAVDLIVDLILNSQFPSSEIEKEREVICDEINSYLDSPSDAVYDDFEDVLYGGTPLGHNILGTVGSVKNITGDMCREWLDRHYRASNMVAFYAGSMAEDTFLRKVTPLLSTLPAGKADAENAVARLSDVPDLGADPFVKEKVAGGIHQAHTVMGRAMEAVDVGERITLALLTNILGGPGMNSLLNVDLRERKGLVYNVESTLTNWRDSTMFTTYFGTDPEDNVRCMKLVEANIDAVANGFINARRLAAARKQYRGQLVLARENIENRVIGVARSVLLHGYALTAERTDSILENITPESVAAAARRLLPLSALTFRP